MFRAGLLIFRGALSFACSPVRMAVCVYYRGVACFSLSVSRSLDYPVCACTHPVCLCYPPHVCWARSFMPCLGRPASGETLACDWTTQTEPDNFPRLMELMQDMQEHGQVRCAPFGLHPKYMKCSSPGRSQRKRSSPVP